MNRMRLAAFLLAIFLTTLILSKEKVFVVVITSGEQKPYETALEGFRQRLEGAGFDLWLSSYTLKENNAEEIIEEVSRKNPDLILTLGSEASILAKERIKKCPVIFSMVLNPISVGLLTAMNEPAENLTGASLDIPVGSQLAALKSLGLKKIGVIYTARTRLIIQQARTEAERLGLELIEKQVSLSKEVPSALGAIKKKADGLWMVADPIVYSPKQAEYILLFTLRHQIPFMGLSSNWTRAGALVSLSCDYYDIGSQSAEQAEKVFRGTSIAKIPPTIPRKTYLSLNLKTAERLNLRVPKSLLKEAKEIIE